VDAAGSADRATGDGAAVGGGGAAPLAAVDCTGNGTSTEWAVAAADPKAAPDRTSPRAPRDVTLRHGRGCLEMRLLSLGLRCRDNAGSRPVADTPHERRHDRGGEHAGCDEVVKISTFPSRPSGVPGAGWPGRGGLRRRSSQVRHRAALEIPAVSSTPLHESDDPVVERGPAPLVERLRTGSRIAVQRRRWSRRARTWNDGVVSNPGLSATIDAVVAEAGVEHGMTVLDMGCGSGQLTIPIARRAARVVAVDVSGTMIDLLNANLRREQLVNVSSLTTALERLALPSSSFDVIVSNYALHHLTDVEKRRLLAAALVWLRPGGRLVIGDLMLGRGADRRDRAIIAEKVATLARRGPGGWWRIVKNGWRFAARTSERPLSLSAWERLIRDAGFARVTTRPVVSEAAIVSGVRPMMDAGQPGRR